MSRQRPVATPLRQRIRRFLGRPLPVLVWLGAIALALMLARRTAVHVDAVGVVQVRQAMVAPRVSGTIEFVHPELFEPVSVGDVVAGLDASALVAQLATARAEVARLHALLAAERSRLAVDQQDREAAQRVDIHRFAWNLEQAELDLLDRCLVQELARVEKERLTIAYTREQRLSDGMVGQRASLEEARLALQAVDTRLGENEKILAAARDRRDTVRRRLDQARERGVDLVDPGDTDIQLDPIRKAVAVQQARLDELAVTRSALTLRAPIDGRVCRQFLRPGEVVEAGTPILEIADPRAARIVAHVPEQSGRTDLRPGDPVEIRRRTAPVQIIQGRILRVGPAREQIPLQARRIPDQVEWGFPILITAAALPVDPGETVDVRIPSAPR